MAYFSGTYVNPSKFPSANNVAVDCHLVWVASGGHHLVDCGVGIQVAIELGESLHHQLKLVSVNLLWQYP